MFGTSVQLLRERTDILSLSSIRLDHSLLKYYWSYLSKRKAYDEEPRERTVPIEEILDYLAFAHYKVRSITLGEWSRSYILVNLILPFERPLTSTEQEGMLKRAYVLTKELKRLSPDHPRVDSNLQYFNQLLQDKVRATADRSIAKTRREIYNVIHFMKKTLTTGNSH